MGRADGKLEGRGLMPMRSSRAMESLNASWERGATICKSFLLVACTSHGSCEVYVFIETELFSMKYCARTRPFFINKIISLFCQIEKNIRGTEKGDLMLQLRGLDMNNKEPGLFGLGRSDPFFSIAKKNSFQLNDFEDGAETWNVIYRSEPINNNLNPMWDKVQLGLPELCFGDLEWPLKITIYDYENNGNHVFMGELRTCVKEMQQKISIRGNADRNQALRVTRMMKGRELTAGIICVLEASISPASEKKIIHSSKAPKGFPLSPFYYLALFCFIVVFLPLIIGLELSSQEETKIATTQRTTFDSYYNDYERDLNVTLRDGIKSGYLSSHHVLDPQARALSWLMKKIDGGSNLTTDTLPDLLQRYAMAVFYYAMDGENWNRNTTFLSDASVCKWDSQYGDRVGCNGAGQVTSLQLSKFVWRCLIAYSDTFAFVLCVCVCAKQLILASFILYQMVMFPSRTRLDR